MSNVKNSQAYTMYTVSTSKNLSAKRALSRAEGHANSGKQRPPAAASAERIPHPFPSEEKIRLREIFCPRRSSCPKTFLLLLVNWCKTCNSRLFFSFLVLRPLYYIIQLFPASYPPPAPLCRSFVRVESLSWGLTTSRVLVVVQACFVSLELFNFVRLVNRQDGAAS